MCVNTTPLYIAGSHLLFPLSGLNSRISTSHIDIYLLIILMIGSKRTKLTPSQTAYLLKKCIPPITAVGDIKTILGLTVLILYAFTFSPLLCMEKVYYCDRKLTIRS